jgi:hypothetical protein
MMRLVCFLNERDLNELKCGKQIALSLKGMDNVMIHFDPDPEEIITPPVVSEPDRLELTETGRLCDHCQKTFKSHQGLMLHKNWLAKQNGASP